MDISPENFRKTLSRSRKKIRDFMHSKCGLVDSNNLCRCRKKIDFLVEGQKINPKELQFARHSKRSIDLIEKINSIEKTVAVFRSVPDFKVPEPIMHKVRKTINLINI